MKIMDYKVSWEHNNEKAKKYYTSSERIVEIHKVIDSSSNREESKNQITKLLQDQIRYASSFSKCIIEKDNGDIYEGMAYLHPNDTFDRKKGMDVSFKDAVLNIDNKQTRRLLWRWYLKNCRHNIKLPEIKETKDESISKYGM